MGSRLIAKWGRGIRLKKRAARLFRWEVNRVMGAVRQWGKKLRRRLRFGPGSGYALLGRIREEVVPKGHVAVYVGRKEEAAVERVVVPVIYINHPLFGRLLREAEEKYGYDYPGGIMLPCHVSEFQSVQSVISAGKKWKSSHLCYDL